MYCSYKIFEISSWQRFILEKTNEVIKDRMSRNGHAQKDYSSYFTLASDWTQCDQAIFQYQRCRDCGCVYSTGTVLSSCRASKRYTGWVLIFRNIIVAKNRVNNQFRFPSPLRTYLSFSDHRQPMPQLNKLACPYFRYQLILGICHSTDDQIILSKCSPLYDPPLSVSLTTFLNSSKLSFMRAPAVGFSGSLWFGELNRQMSPQMISYRVCVGFQSSLTIGRQTCPSQSRFGWKILFFSSSFGALCGQLGGKSRVNVYLPPWYRLSLVGATMIRICMMFFSFGITYTDLILSLLQSWMSFCSRSFAPVTLLSVSLPPDFMPPPNIIKINSSRLNLPSHFTVPLSDII